MKKQYIITVESVKQTLCDGCVFEFANRCPDDCLTDTIWSITEAEEYEGCRTCLQAIAGSTDYLCLTCNKEIEDV